MNVIRCTTAAVLTTVALVACSTPTPLPVDGSERPLLTGSAGGPLPAAAVADRDAAEDGYRSFWVVAYSLDAHPVSEWHVRLSAVATDPLMPRLLAALTDQQENGIRQYGQVLPRPVTVEVRGDVATVVDCQDASGAGEAYADTGMPKTTGRSRTPIAASLRRGADGRWRVSQAKELDATC